MILQQATASGGFNGLTGNAPIWARVFSNEVFTICAGAVLVSVLPALVNFRELSLRLPLQLSGNSTIEQLAAFSVGILLLGRLTSHPGAAGLRYVLPVLTVTYGTAITVELFTRGDYSGQQILVSYLLALGWYYATYVTKRRYNRRSIAVVPVGRGADLCDVAGADWTVLDRPELPNNRHFDAVSADLHCDLSSGWDAFLAKTALSGVPIYHATQVRESMTGRTNIEHLSENVIGSLIPNTLYAKFKAIMDVSTALFALAVLAPVLIGAAIAVKLDSPGPALFKQRRTGHRGREFTIYKFRTMYADTKLGQSSTLECDPRITRVGAILRRTRLDELPQILNVIRGEMSWIGPRPMGLDGKGYQREIPFFQYRHIVKPGITGWAQVQQGHTNEIEGATTKLQYDFYYIKNFSFWVDLLICFKTVGIVMSGNGSR